MAYFGGKKTSRPWSQSTGSVPLYAFIAVLLLFAAIETFNFIPGRGNPKHMAVASEPVPEPAPVTNLQSVLVPMSSVRPGEKLEKEMFKSVEMDLRGIEEYAVTEFTEIAGKFAISMMPEGAPVLTQYIGSTKAGTITARIPKGFRAVAIPVDAESGVEGWVQPNVKVDVVWSTIRRGQQIVSTIVENAEVLSAERSLQAVDQNGNNRGTGAAVPNHVTLLVDLKDAQKIQLAKRSIGSLSLSLRGDEDNSNAGSRTLSVDRLLKPEDMEMLDRANGTIEIDGKEMVLTAKGLVPAWKVIEGENN